MPQSSGDVGCPLCRQRCGRVLCVRATGESRSSRIKVLCSQPGALWPPLPVTAHQNSSRQTDRQRCRAGQPGGPAVPLHSTTPCAGCPSSPLQLSTENPLMSPTAEVPPKGPAPYPSNLEFHILVLCWGSSCTHITPPMVFLLWRPQLCVRTSHRDPFCYPRLGVSLCAPPSYQLGFSHRLL